MPPIPPTLSPLLLQRVVDGLKPPVAVVTDTDPPPAGSPPFGSVVVAVSDVAALRTALVDLPALGRARMVAVVVADAVAPLAVRLDPRWPALQDLDARIEDGAAVTVARFTAKLDVAEVLTGIAYADGGRGHGGLLVGRDYDPEDKVPVDVVIDGGPLEESPVLGRAPMVLSDRGPEPLDETLFNPIGFRRDWDRGVVDLDSSWTASPRLIAELRDTQGVRVPPDADERVVAALAMSGIPLVTADDRPDLDDPLSRERHSIRQRRAALGEHSIWAWRQRLGDRAGVRIAEPDEGDPVLVTADGASYAPEVRTDLLLARRYSGADVVEMPVSTTEPTECFVRELLGGPLIVDRGLLREVGAAEAILAAGGTIYRTHALIDELTDERIDDESEAP